MDIKLYLLLMYNKLLNANHGNFYDCNYLAQLWMMEISNHRINIIFNKASITLIISRTLYFLFLIDKLEIYFALRWQS